MNDLEWFHPSKLPTLGRIRFDFISYNRISKIMPNSIDFEFLPIPPEKKKKLKIDANNDRYDSSDQNNNQQPDQTGEGEEFLSDKQKQAMKLEKELLKLKFEKRRERSIKHSNFKHYRDGFCVANLLTFIFADRTFNLTKQFYKFPKNIDRRKKKKRNDRRKLTGTNKIQQNNSHDDYEEEIEDDQLPAVPVFTSSESEDENDPDSNQQRFNSRNNNNQNNNNDEDASEADAVDSSNFITEENSEILSLPSARATSNTATRVFPSYNNSLHNSRRNSFTVEKDKEQKEKLKQKEKEAANPFSFLKSYKKSAAERRLSEIGANPNDLKKKQKLKQKNKITANLENHVSDYYKDIIETSHEKYNYAYQSYLTQRANQLIFDSYVAKKQTTFNLKQITIQAIQTLPSAFDQK
jgi:hypothetical protein